MVRRFLDIFVSAMGLLLLSLPLVIILFLVWRQDRHSPFYVAERAGKDGVPFRMVKIRSMVINADKSGVESTSANDNRITPLGHFIRRWKVDELSQLWNVLTGDMSLVGPRPNTLNEVSTYTEEERELLSVRPGITDFSSIVFSDEGDILKHSTDPDRDYTQLIRPWKSQMGLCYVRNYSMLLDIGLILLTLLALFDKSRAHRGVSLILKRLGSSDKLIAVSRRDVPLVYFTESAH
ncbi:MAG: sugar transferase [Sphingomonadales bacterium]|jgi:lipopolysaccharide/colanic/teichoic acid biosynthesis glycosyltransferase